MTKAKSFPVRDERVGKLLRLIGFGILVLMPQVRAQGPPNILFLFMDDMRWDMAAYTGNEIITTPTMDTLAAQGTVFDNAFATTAICMVSQASVFMGQYMASHGITNFSANVLGVNLDGRLDDI